jgi:hypothetical protein
MYLSFELPEVVLTFFFSNKAVVSVKKETASFSKELFVIPNCYHLIAVQKILTLHRCMYIFLQIGIKNFY